MLGRLGVLGVVVTPGRFLPDLVGNANSFEVPASAGVGGDVPPTSGEACVAERWLGEETEKYLATNIHLIR